MTQEQQELVGVKHRDTLLELDKEIMDRIWQEEAGGSGYVYTSSTASNYPSGCLLNSSYYLTNSSTIAGNSSFVAPDGSNETGHSGNGYARITIID